ncbi:unnamed protein product, partial [Striga asiatica]
MAEQLKDKEKEGERWTAEISNLTEISENIDSLQRLLIKKAVYVDGETFAKASLSSEQSRTIKLLEQRVETLERELDSAISAAARARTEKRQAEASQKAGELRALEISRELENTTIFDIPYPYTSVYIKILHKLDVDRFGYLDLEEDVQNLGYKSWGILYYKIPGVEGPSSMKLHNDDGIMEMITCIKNGHNVIDVYVDDCVDEKND